MFLWLGTSKSTRRIKGGRREKAFCPECGETAQFVEVEITESIKLFSVVDLYSDNERAFRCVECDSVGQIVEDSELPAAALENLSPEAAERVERARAAERRAGRGRETASGARAPGARAPRRLRAGGPQDPHGHGARARASRVCE